MTLVREGDLVFVCLYGFGFGEVRLAPSYDINYSPTVQHLIPKKT